MASGQIVDLKIEVARHRCEALAREVKQLRNEEFSSRGSRLLIAFAEKAAHAVLTYLAEEEALPDKHLLNEQELEDRVHRVSKLIPFLHYLLGFVEGSQMDVTPVPLVSQLRRFARTVIPQSEVLVTTRPELNYSIMEVASRVRDLLQPTPLGICCDILPSFLFVVTIPRAESGDVLLHCILSHELGHGLYQQHGLATKLLPGIVIDQEQIKGLTAIIVRQMPGAAPPLVEVEVRNAITQQVTSRISNWTQELCSDAFGIQLFGPAYYFSFIYFSLAFAHLDKDSPTHPPPRLRLRLMSRILRRLYPESSFKGEVDVFIRYWESQSQKAIPLRDAVARIALLGIDSVSVLDAIDIETETCIESGKRYGPKKYRDDVSVLKPVLVHAIPPGERMVEGKFVPNEISSILNAGWDLLLSDLPSLASNLPAREAKSPYNLRQKLQELLLKALEISETRRSWQEKTDAAGI
jgi:hypothetical protein